MDQIQPSSQARCAAAWRDQVVSRSYAESCGVLDILVAFGLVFVV